MSANRGKDTGPELLLRKALWAQGKKGFRLHKRIHSTRPDMIYPTKSIAIFINGCFWHRCPCCKFPLPKNNREFWKKKFRTNKARDRRKVVELEKNGWKVYVFWECEVKNSPEKMASRVGN